MSFLILGAGNPIPTFISNRLYLWDKMGVKCSIVVRDKNIKPSSEKQKIIMVPGNSLKNLPSWLNLTLIAIISPIQFFKLWRCAPKLKIFSRLRWSLERLPIILEKSIDLFSLQWIGMGRSHQWLKQFFDVPIIAMARGLQVTVEPTIDQRKRAELIQCFEAVDYIHCVSEDIYKRCLSWGAPKEKLFINYNGVDLFFFTPPNKRLEHQELKLISTGSLIWRKGYWYQMQTIAILKSRGLNPQLTIIGEGSDKMGLAYTAQVLGIEENIVFKGFLSPEQIRSELQQSDIYISTSIAEGLANSTVEAAACGLPIVAFQCEGMDEVIEDGTTGFIVPFGDLTGLAEQIIHLYHKQDERLEMGRSARKKMEKEFDAEYWTAQSIKTYEEIIRKYKTRS